MVQKKVKLLLLQTLVVSGLFSVVSWFLLPYFLDWIANPVYQKYMHWYPWLLFAMVINAVGLVPHFALYSSGEDKPIIYSHIAGFLVFCGTTWVVSGQYSALAVPIGLNTAFVVILIIKALLIGPCFKKKNLLNLCHYKSEVKTGLSMIRYGQQDIT